MNQELPQLIDESIKLEENVANLYLYLYKQFPEDSDFWWEMQLEEKKHATLIRDSKDPLLSQDIFPSELLSSSLETLIGVNNKLISLMNDFNENPPSREAAFNAALEVERSAGEIHFNNAMDKTSSSGVMKVFQELTDDDKDHVNRILYYMKDKGIG
ncbi:MAG: rubrerythrin family protein [Spirochaetota bacterium]|nr:rubrerythrin family protein [Spirochaetota bacterium]